MSGGVAVFHLIMFSHFYRFVQKLSLTLTQYTQDVTPSLGHTVAMSYLASAVGLECPEHEEALEEDAADVDAAEVAVSPRHGRLDGLAEGAAEHGIHLRPEKS